jgi:hypothetical protein
MLRETTIRGLCGLVRSSRTSERGGEGDCVKEGGGAVGVCVRGRRTESTSPPHFCNSTWVQYCRYSTLHGVCVCVYYCSTYGKDVRLRGGG